MNYSTAFKYITASPNWKNNVLMGGVCQLIPVVGPIVFQGYMCEVVDARVAPMGDAALVPTAPGAPVNYQVPPSVYPDFNFGRFGEYLMRGLWPFLVALVASIPMVFLMFLAELPIFLIFILKLHGVVAGLFVALACFLYLLFVVLMSVAMTAFILRAMLTRNFAAAFDLKFAMDFIRRVGLMVMLNALVTMAVSIPLTIAGMMLCFIGIYPAIAILGFFHAELLAQTYREYLVRGGTPIVAAATIGGTPVVPGAPPVSH